MRVAWIAGARVVGGAERVSLEIAARLGGRGHDVEALLPRRGPLAAAARARGIRTREAVLGGALDLLGVVAIWRMLRERRPAIAMVTTSDEWVWSSLVPRPRTTRLVLVRHMALPLPRRVERLAARAADAIVAVSPAVRAALEASGTIPPTLVHEIANPVRFSRRTAPPGPTERVAARARLGLPTSGAWIGFLGGTEPAKGIDRLLDAAARAVAQAPSLRVVVAGRGDPMRAAALARARGLDERVHAVGEIEDVELLLTAVDVLAMATPSRLGEGSPLALIEAMACGTAVVAPAVGGVADVVGRGADAAGWLAAADDTADLARALAAALADEEARRQAAAHGLARSARHDPDAAAAAYDRLFAAISARAERS